MTEIECKGTCGSIIENDGNDYATTPCGNSKDGWCCICRFKKYSRRFCEPCNEYWQETQKDIKEENFIEDHGLDAWYEQKNELILPNFIFRVV